MKYHLELQTLKSVLISPTQRKHLISTTLQRLNIETALDESEMSNKSKHPKAFDSARTKSNCQQWFADFETCFWEKFASFLNQNESDFWMLCSIIAPRISSLSISSNICTNETYLSTTVSSQFPGCQTDDLRQQTNKLIKHFMQLMNLILPYALHIPDCLYLRRNSRKLLGNIWMFWILRKIRWRRMW